MARATSLSLRRAGAASSSDEVVISLVTIRHPALVEPVRLSSDPTERLSTDPLVYGTRSAGLEYLFVLMGAIVPDDQQASPPQSTLIFENVDRRMIAPLRSITTPLSIDLRVVLASTPDDAEAEFTDLRGVKSSFDADKITLDISREPFTSEPWPSGRMTRARFPGLFR